jgi:ATP-dependent Lon protease
MNSDLIIYMIKNYTLESGVRELERILDKLVRHVVINNIKADKLTEKEIQDIFGNPIYEIRATKANIGSCNILGVSPLGGHIINIQSLLIPSGEDLVITGTNSEELKDNVQLVMSHLKAYGLIDYTSIKNQTLHLHFNNNYMLKGSSGSLGIASSIISLLQNRIISEDVAFSGKMDLYGNISGVSSVKEKIITAYNNNIKTVYLPLENEKDIKEVPDFILENLEIIFVSNYQEIYDRIFKKQ